MNYHFGARYQKGRGIGSLFSGLLRGFTPLAQMGLSFGRKLVNSDMAKTIAGTALDTGKKLALGMAADLLEGKNVKDSAQAQLNEAKKNIATTLRGGGCKKRRSKRKNTNIKKQKLEYNLLEND